MRVNVIATTGTDLDPAVFGPQPAHIAMAHFVPQALVLRHVDAVVCHAGSGTMLGALAEGRPIVALPMAADQFANAEQIVRTGAGLAVRPDERYAGGHPDCHRAGARHVSASPRPRTRCRPRSPRCRRPTSGWPNSPIGPPCPLPDLPTGGLRHLRYLRRRGLDEDQPSVPCAGAGLDRG